MSMNDPNILARFRPARGLSILEQCRIRKEAEAAETRAREIKWAKSRLEDSSNSMLEWIALGSTETAATEAKWAARYANKYLSLESK